jgi:hypothetical protein
VLFGVPGVSDSFLVSLGTLLMYACHELPLLPLSSISWSPVITRGMFIYVLLRRHAGGGGCIYKMSGTVEMHYSLTHCTTNNPATGEGMDKSTFVHTQIQIIIIHFLPSPFPPIPNG